MAINSHLVQRNGILNNISVNGQVVELRVKDVNHWEGNVGSPFELKQVGVRQALSHKLFCNVHDTKIFRSIEHDSCDLLTYEAFLLFSYRATCAEIRKKELNIEKFSRMLSAETLSDVVDENMLKDMITGNSLGLRDLNILKHDLEDEIESPNENFVFFSYRYPKLDVYASSIFSATSLDDSPELGELDLNNFYFHVLPLKNELLLLIGVNAKYSDRKMLDFCQSWMHIEFDVFKVKLSNVFINNIENWGLSIPLCRRISKRNLEALFIEIHRRIPNFGVDLNTDINIFS